MNKTTDQVKTPVPVIILQRKNIIRHYDNDEQCQNHNHEVRSHQIIARKKRSDMEKTLERIKTNYVVNYNLINIAVRII